MFKIWLLTAIKKYTTYILLKTIVFTLNSTITFSLSFVCIVFSYKASLAAKYFAQILGNSLFILMALRHNSKSTGSSNGTLKRVIFSSLFLKLLWGATHLFLFAILSNKNWHWKYRYDWHLTSLSPVTTVFIYISYYMQPMNATRAEKCNVINGRVRAISEGRPAPCIFELKMTWIVTGCHGGADCSLGRLTRKSHYKT